MEYCMAARALKPSLRKVGFKELAIMNATTEQALLEDFLCLNATAASTSGEDFSVVDCFFDFSNGEFKDSAFIQEQNHLGDEEEEEKDSLSVSSQDRAEDDNSTNSSIFSDYHLPSELSLPEEDKIAELEWVSHYVYYDSSPEISLLCPVPGGVRTKSHAENRSEPETKPVLSRVPPFLGVRVPGKERTKKARLPSQAWPVVGNWLTESSPAASPASSSSSSTPCLVPNSAVATFDLSPGFGEPPTKKQKKKVAVQTEGDIGSVQFQRRCSHCQVQKTPQWRTGPLGPKTLCNACGVRYKSGRLFPEYRPACSPTFSSDMHSNSHRKVLEMRKKKETVGPEDGMNRILPEYGLNQMVPTF